ncbi:pre-mRNA 3' end processing protein WDR33-like [Pongo abelii]|uniref:pre-mRNA 3' end processing protein WDR33-like n=1 Tax=Pongo abelii TaxID=9601 RepID=UPI00300514E5
MITVVDVIAVVAVARSTVANRVSHHPAVPPRGRQRRVGGGGGRVTPEGGQKRRRTAQSNADAWVWRRDQALSLGPIRFSSGLAPRHPPHCGPAPASREIAGASPAELRPRELAGSLLSQHSPGPRLLSLPRQQSPGWLLGSASSAFDAPSARPPRMQRAGGRFGADGYCIRVGPPFRKYKPHL